MQGREGLKQEREGCQRTPLLLIAAGELLGEHVGESSGEAAGDTLPIQGFKGGDTSAETVITV